jgi:hypothetical protein
MFSGVVAGLYSAIIVASSLGIKRPWPGYRQVQACDTSATAAEFNVRPEQLLRTPQFYYLFASATLLATGQQFRKSLNFLSF